MISLISFINIASLATTMTNKNFEIFYANGTKKNVGTFYCIGRNYAEHAKEMGASVPKEPLVFTKPASALVNNNGAVNLPDYSNNVHHEVELVLAVKSDCYQVSQDNALDFIDGIAIGLDLTLRDLQSEIKSTGKPWAIAKSFYQSAPVSNFVSLNDVDLDNINFNLKINGELRQTGTSRDMIFDFSKLISYLSHRFYLRTGDCIFTGTPSGVSQVVAGDKAEASLLGKSESIIKLNIGFE